MSDGKPIVAIISVDGEVEVPFADDFGGVKWLTMPQETFDQVMNIVENPDQAVRAERPRRK